MNKMTEEFASRCRTSNCTESDYERFVKSQMTEFIKFYDGSWRDLFNAVVNITAKIDLNKFAREGQLIELKIAKDVGADITSRHADIAAQNFRLGVLQYLKSVGVLVSKEFELEAIERPTYRALKFLDENDLFNDPQFVADELIKHGRIQLLNGLKIKDLAEREEDLEEDREADLEKRLWRENKENLLTRFNNDYSAPYFGEWPDTTRLPPKFRQADPTPNGKYLEWLVLSYLGGGIQRYEDLTSQVRPALEDYLYLRSTGKIRRDPNPYKDYTNIMNLCGTQGCRMRRRGKMFGLPGLYTVFEPYKEELEARREKEVEQEVSEKDYRVVIDNEEIKVIVPLTEKGACKYGAGTKWCTAARNDNMFEHYNEQGELYIVIPKRPEHIGEKYQIHVELKQVINEVEQVMDESDKEYSISELTDRFPSLFQIEEIKTVYLNLNIRLMSLNELKQLVEQGFRPTNKTVDILLYGFQRNKYEYLRSLGLKASEVGLSNALYRGLFGIAEELLRSGLKLAVEGKEEPGSESREFFVNLMIKHGTEAIALLYKYGIKMPQIVIDSAEKYISDNGGRRVNSKVKEGIEFIKSH